VTDQALAPPAEQPAAPEKAPSAQKAHWWDPLVIPVLAVFTALVIGALVIIFSNPDVLTSWKGFFRHPVETLRLSLQTVWDTYYALFTGAFGNPKEIFSALFSGDWEELRIALRPLSETITAATPLIFAGLCVAIPFRAGLFNIGGEGQITVGALLAVMVGFSFTSLPGPLLIVAIVVAGFIGGAVWGAIPGALKAKTGAHEVIVTIMLNWIGTFLALYALSLQFFRPAERADPISKPVGVAFPHLIGSDLRVHAGILVAIGIAAAVSYLMNRTTVGFEYRAVGANPDAARAAGMSPGRTYVSVMALAGGIGGLAGANLLLSTSPSVTPGYSSGFGFDGIALALLGRANPWGVVASAFLFGALRAGSRTMQAVTQTPVDIVVVIQALVIMFVAAPQMVRGIYRIKPRRSEGLELVTRGL